MKLSPRLLACKFFNIHYYEQAEDKTYFCPICDKKAVDHLNVKSDYHAYRSNKRHP